MTFSIFKKRRWAWPAVFVTAILAVVIAHLWGLSSVPQGLYQDESAVGYNADLIAETGYDEWDQFYPVFFKSFNDYKSPVHIYTAAVVFSFFGTSVFILRFTSALFFFLFAFCMFVLVRERNKDEKIKNVRILVIYTLLVCGFMPWFFTYSRIAFEVISQLAVTTCSLLLLYLVYHSKKLKYPNFLPILLGLSIGISAYTYATARLLSFIFFVVVASVYFRRKEIQKHILVAISFLVSLIPFGFYSLGNQGAMTGRFKGIGYMFDQSKSVMDKIVLFFRQYFEYWNPEFLLLQGDGNLRHATGYGGEVFFIIFLLFLFGFVYAVVSKKIFKDKFMRCIGILLIFSPVAAALTLEGTPHATRSILMGLYIVLFSIFGFSVLLKAKHEYLKKTILIIVFGMLIAESGLYLSDYFFRYGDRSRRDFGTHGLRQAIEKAIEQDPEKIVVSNHTSHANVEFYERTLKKTNVDIARGHPIAEANSCVIFYPGDEGKLGDESLKFTDLNMDSNNSLVRVRCYTLDQ